MIAITTIADTVAILVFATFLFLLGTGLVWLLGFLFRLIRGKPRPEEPQSLYVSFEAADEWEEEGNALGMQRFGDYLASRLRGKRLGLRPGTTIFGLRFSVYGVFTDG